MKQNALLNGEWSKHVRPRGKKTTAKLRRSEDKKTIHNFVLRTEEDLKSCRNSAYKLLVP